MKNNKPQIINYWQLFLLRYLLLENGSVNFVPCRKEATELLKHFLDFIPKLNLKIISAGVKQQTKAYLLKEYKDRQGGFVKKACDNKLTSKDLSFLLNNYSSISTNQIEPALDIINNLFIVFDFENSEAKIRDFLNDCIKSILQGKTKTDKRISQTTNFYSYYYQKNYFIKSVPRYLEECVSDEIKLVEERDDKLFGEKVYRTTFLETVFTLETESIVTVANMGITETEPHEIENLIPFNKTIKITSPLATVTIKVSDFIKRMPISPKTVPTLAPQLPVGWSLKPDDHQLYITKFGQTIFIFKNKSAAYCRYFRCLWYNYGRHVTYPEIYEYDTADKYPYIRGKNYKINDNIRRSVNLLKKEFVKKGIPIKIETAKGHTLTIKE